ncbi:uncharacterized protein PV07_00729 [Cladophialophora immunda]|uniref:Uncharacterized protein n=1 Tax=Cladophialophora immunda TaxID=569365 RepID=A0A0D2CVN6_9EURO|nr:uncharacterized protein PV07_00729 [Cladophialophora immunda]KIW33915.1 hypothetical protein PV07_00729 [Cladophialophora immunda]OQU94465.1 SNF2 family domain-containing protein [Cladophialophora immunda]
MALEWSSTAHGNKRRKLDNWDYEQSSLTPYKYNPVANSSQACLPHDVYEQSYRTPCRSGVGHVSDLTDIQSTTASRSFPQPHPSVHMGDPINTVRTHIAAAERHLSYHAGMSASATFTASSEFTVSQRALSTDPSDVLGEDSNVDQECIESISHMTICYGMLCNIQVELLVSALSLMECQALSWDGPDGATTLRNPTGELEVAKLSAITAQVLRTLSLEAGAEFQFWLSPQQQPGQQTTYKSGEMEIKGSVRATRSLSIIVYGPNNMATRVGDWLDGLKMYLQVPGGCDRDVPYINPHCLASNQVSTTYTRQLAADLSMDEPESQDSHRDLFSDLYTDSVFDLAPQPYAIASSLHSHQRQALTFMIERENGWNFSGTRNDIWRSHIDAFGVRRYKNTVCGLTQTRAPESFRGGIIADEMGLGKTCTMLALIAANPSQYNFSTGRFDCVKSTLVVVPVPLLFVWEKQIQEHFRRGCVRHTIFYGPDRQQNANFQDHDIVVTTYTTVLSEWKNRRVSRSQTESSPLFRTFWHRIILDEAHVIRTKETICAKSIYALQGERRWCITGTPLQNRLTDIFSLLHFLKVHPYDNMLTFQEQILRPWKSRMDEDALKRLQSIWKVITIRRGRNVIALPDRIVHTEEVCFTEDERALYERARTGVIEVLNNAMDIDSSTSGSVYLNALQRINDLRYICNHGVTPPRRREHLEPMQPLGEVLSPLLDEMFEKEAETMNPLCGHCGADLLWEEEDRSRFLLTPDICYNSSSSPTCRSCLQYEPPSLSPSGSSLSSGVWSPTRLINSMRPSSKIKALVGQIQRLPLNDKCIVFSYWTSSLDAIEEALKQAQIKFCRYDGRLSQTQRSQVLNSFTSDASLRVFLLSITCGGEGLDLTAANHAFLLEPQWNPMREEQAMARVHRLGQKKTVRLVRLVVKDTFEENIIRLQGRKRTLADLIVDRAPLQEGAGGKKQLYYLRELVV